MRASNLLPASLVCVLLFFALEVSTDSMLASRRNLDFLLSLAAEAAVADHFAARVLSPRV